MGNFVFIGDSILDWFNCNYYFPELDIINHGVAGDIINGVISRLPQAVNRQETQSILVMIGHNDLCMGADVAQAMSKFEKICALIKEKNISNVYISGLLPIDFVDNTIVMDYNNGLKELSLKYGFTFIPVRDNFMDNNLNINNELSDGLHLTEKGYNVLAKVFKNYIV